MDQNSFMYLMPSVDVPSYKYFGVPETAIITGIYNKSSRERIISYFTNSHMRRPPSVLKN